MNGQFRKILVFSCLASFCLGAAFGRTLMHVWGI